MKILSWNVNGLRSVFRKDFLDFVKRHNPDILCLQEIKIDDRLIRGLGIEGYNLYANCADKKGYSGVAVYCKNKPVGVEFDIGMLRFDSEGRMLILKFDDFILMNFYLPHGGRDKSNLGYKLESYDFVISRIRKILRDKKKVIICGDFNVAMGDVDLARPVQNRNNIMFGLEERRRLRGFFDVGLIDSFREVISEGGHYSWWPYLCNCRERNIGWRIDYIFVSDDLKIEDAFILKDIFGSDHCPVGVDLR